MFLVQACLRAQPVVADEAKLAIVFTYFFLLIFSSKCRGVHKSTLLFTNFGGSQEAEFHYATIF